MKKILSLFLAILMVMTMFSIGVSAAPFDADDSAVTKEELMAVDVCMGIFPVAKGFNTVVVLDYFSGLSDVYIYAWDSEEGYNTDGKYPGEPMKYALSSEPVPGADYYVAYIAEEYDRFIVLDYNSETQSVEDGCQSQEFVLDKSLAIRVQHGDTGEYVFEDWSADFYSYPGLPVTPDEEVTDDASKDEATFDEASKDEATFDEPTEPTEPTEPEEEPVFPSEPKPAGTNRYYFYLPEQWINDYAYTAGIYWWEGSISGDYWPGNEAKSAGVEGVYYYDIATDTPTIIWDNYLDGGMDSNSDIYISALQTIDIPVSGSDYDGMIFVVNLSDEQINSFNNKVTYGGQWYYYYGSGQYGTAPTKAEAEEVFTNRSFGEWATPDEAPTEPEEIPTNPVMPTTPVKPTKPADPEEPTEPTGTPTESAPASSEATEPSDLATVPASSESTTAKTEPTETTGTGGEWVPCLMGDADLNGKVNVKDATLIQKHAAHMFSFAGLAEITADVNNDTNINVKDATVIQKYLAKIEVDFVVGDYVEIEVFPWQD